MKYMLIHCADESVDFGPQNDCQTPGTPAARALETWLSDLTARGVLLDGARLRPVGDATTVQVREGNLLLSDGPFAETKEQVAGYDVIDCADLDEAIEIASRHPSASIGTVEIRPFWVGRRSGDLLRGAAGAARLPLWAEPATAGAHLSMPWWAGTRS